MLPEISYFIKVNVAIMLFYAFYRLFCTQDTFLRWRRFTLLCFWCIAWIYPFINFQDWVQQQAPTPIQELKTFYVEIIYITASPVPQETTNISWEQWGILVYLAGVAFLGIRFLIQLIGISRLAYRCRTERIAHTKVHILNKPEGPFSFFRWIFIHPDSTKKPQEIEDILIHEQTHAREWHSIDILFSELNCILCWMNPFSWLLKREVRDNLEYLADRKVIISGNDTRSYQYHLLGLAHQKTAVTLYNHFNVLPIKKRIIMMNKKRTQNIGRTKYFMFFLFTMALMIFNNIESVARSTKEVYNELAKTLSTEEPEKTSKITTKKDKEDKSASTSPEDYKTEKIDNNIIITTRPGAYSSSGDKKSDLTEIYNFLKQNPILTQEEDGKVSIEYTIENGKITLLSVKKSLASQPNLIQSKIIGTKTKTSPKE